MRFSDKLDFLMCVTKTSNSALARAENLDASYISRLRSGKRQIPKSSEVIGNMATYFARRCTDEFQQKTVSDALNVRFPEDSLSLAEKIARWLSKENENSSDRMTHFLEGLSSIKSRGAGAETMKLQSDPLGIPRDAISVYYGIEGKRQATEDFLSEVAACETPQTLLLFSDEETSWMTADLAYAKRWAELMERVLQRGNRITIIHTISRDLDEMLSAIGQWMPLYMSGMIEPYFYPKKRDGVFRNTLFIAPETAAVVSGSVGNQIAESANLLFRDRTAVGSYAAEFMQYLRLCRPLMRIYTFRDRDACAEAVRKFEEASADTLVKTESLSLITMPEPLLTEILRRNAVEPGKLLLNHKIRRRNFQKMTDQNLYTEIIALPEPEAVKNGRVRVAMSDMFVGRDVCYTPREYAEHLRHIAELLEKQKNCRVYPLRRPAEERYTVYAREEQGVIVAKNSQPPVVLSMNEGNMTAAFWDFLKSVIGEKAYQNYDRASVIRDIRDYLARLDE